MGKTCMRVKYCTSNTRTPASGITQCFRETMTRGGERKGERHQPNLQNQRVTRRENNLFFNNFNNYLSSPFEFLDFGCPGSNDHKSISKNY